MSAPYPIHRFFYPCNARHTATCGWSSCARRVSPPLRLLIRFRRGVYSVLHQCLLALCNISSTPRNRSAFSRPGSARTNPIRLLEARRYYDSLKRSCIIPNKCLYTTTGVFSVFSRLSFCRVSRGFMIGNLSRFDTQDFIISVLGWVIVYCYRGLCVPPFEHFEGVFRLALKAPGM